MIDEAVKAAAKRVKDKIFKPKAKVWPKNHPHFNPRHRIEGRERGESRVLNGATGKYETIKWKGPRNPSRWMPHNGAREMARRVRQMERAKVAS